MARSHGRARLGERAYRQVCGQRGRNLTKTMAISPMNIFLSSSWRNECCAFRYFLARARTNIMDPDEWVIFAYDGVPAHRDPAIPVPYVHSLCFPPLDIVERVLSCLKATTKADFSHPEIQRRMDSRKEAKAPGIPLGEFEHNNCLKLGAET